MLPLLTRDPVTNEPLIVTRLEGPSTGLVIEGAFDLGWIGRLSPEQLAFVGELLRQRGNVQKLAAELGIAYNTARARLDEIVAALGVPVEEQPQHSRMPILERLQRGEITFDEAMRLLQADE